MLDKLVQIGFSSPYNLKSHSGGVSGDPAGLGQDPGGQDPGGSVSGAATGAPISSSGPGGSGTPSAPYAPGGTVPGAATGAPISSSGNDPYTAGELLVIKRWRTQEWANSNSTENHRNTLIAKLHNSSKADPNSDELPMSMLQGLLDYELVQIGLAYPGN